MSENIVIEFNIPDFIKIGEMFTVNYTASNPFDDDVDLYMYVSVEGAVVKSINKTIDPLMTLSGAFTLVPDKSPYIFSVRGEAYIGNILVGEGDVKITLGEKAGVNVPLLVGVGSILWGGLSGKR